MCDFFFIIYLFNLFFVFYLIFELQNTISVFTALQADAQFDTSLSF